MKHLLNYGKGNVFHFQCERRLHKRMCTILFSERKQYYDTAHVAQCI
jgi:hypothetical protein